MLTNLRTIFSGPTRFIMLAAVAAFPMCAGTIGTFDVNYRYNAGGCIDGYPSSVTPSSGNPYNCNAIPPGPVFVTAAPGTYEVLALAHGSAGPTAFHIWNGDANSGIRLTTPGMDIGDTFSFQHTAGQIVLYYWDWAPFDNDPNISIRVQLSNSVPEPGSFLLAMLGTAVIGWFSRRSAVRQRIARGKS